LSQGCKFHNGIAKKIFESYNLYRQTVSQNKGTPCF